MVLLEDPGRVDAADPDEVARLVEPLLDLRVVDSLDLAVRIALNREPEPQIEQVISVLVTFHRRRW